MAISVSVYLVLVFFFVNFAVDLFVIWAVAAAVVIFFHVAVVLVVA